MWVACSQPTSFTRAGQMGLGALCFNLGGYSQLQERVQLYRDGTKDANPVGAFVNNQVAALCVVHVGENDEEAREVAGPEGAWFVNKTHDLYRPWHEQGVNVPSSYQFSVTAQREERLDRTVQDHLDNAPSPWETRIQ